MLGHLNDDPAPHSCCERTPGKAFKGVPREKYAITSKWGVMHKDQKFLPIDTSPETCRAAVEESLKQLQVRRAALCA